MIVKFLSVMASSIAPAVGNHLWQSTFFLLAAGLLGWMFRKNHARVRYWLWLAASVKFLVPFSLLITLGSRLAPPHSAAGAGDVFYFAIERVGRPFVQPATSQAATTAFPGLAHLLPALLFAAWFCGFVMILLVWSWRWRQVSAAVRQGVPLREGREVETLRRLECAGGIRRPIEILLSPASLEPGIFGIVRPVLVWPQGISACLEDAHLDAILTHEIRHVRRHDNLAAALHMVVEALFWFHPLVWWLGGRLVEERERACDEEVLESGADRQIYAESILKICEFCVGSPLACVSGVTGADLKKRIIHIMKTNVSRKLTFSRKLLLSAAALAAVSVPVIFGLVKPAPSPAESPAQETTAGIPEYQSVSIKASHPAGDVVTSRMMIHPEGFAAKNLPLHDVIELAYGVQKVPVTAGPDWLNWEMFDIEAAAGKSVIDDLKKLSPAQRGPEALRMLQALLANRFHLALHRESKNLPVYALEIAQSGLKLKAARPGDTYADGAKCPNNDQPCGPGLWARDPGQLTGQAATVTNLVHVLSGGELRGHIVVDKTGLPGKYDFTLQWTPAKERLTQISVQSAHAQASEPSGPPLFTAIQEQLGLKLEPQTAPTEVLVIDHVEKPSEN